MIPSFLKLQLLIDGSWNLPSLFLTGSIVVQRSIDAMISCAQLTEDEAISFH